MLDLLCPVCGGRLTREETVWRCENRHSFDVARSGYVNLLPPSAAGKRHGDDKRMVAARTATLKIGRAVQQECRDRSRMPSSA